jgi:hypothetical protein
MSFPAGVRLLLCCARVARVWVHTRTAHPHKRTHAGVVRVLGVGFTCVQAAAGWGEAATGTVNRRWRRRDAESLPGRHRRRRSFTHGNALLCCAFGAVASSGTNDRAGASVRIGKTFSIPPLFINPWRPLSAPIGYNVVYGAAPERTFSGFHAGRPFTSTFSLSNGRLQRVIGRNYGKRAPVSLRFWTTRTIFIQTSCF